MSNFSRSSVVLEAEPEASRAKIADPDTPFRILVLGDFSGRANRGLNSGLAGRRPVLVDLDNFEDVMQGMDVSLHLPSTSLHVRELDDFLPDNIYRTAEIFRTLAELEYQPPRTAAATASPISAGAGLLDSIVEQSAPSSAPRVEEAGDLAAFIKRVMAPHLEERPDSGKEEWAVRVRTVASEQMNAILHHRDFQALEAAWRATWMLVQRLADDVKIYLLDATLQDLLADPDVFEKILTGPREGWGLLAGNYVFGQSEADARDLNFLGRMAQIAGAPYLAESQPPSGEDEPEHWRDLRRSPAAHWLGLALPRFLLRLPYGKATSPVEGFEFEEMQGSVHTEYLWGNPAFCCAYLIGESFRSHGWELRAGMHRRVDGLPVHVYKAGAENVSKPCAEFLMSEKDAEFIMERGYMPLASMKDQDAVLLVRFQSIADPPTALSGRWS